jgi:hypothetical protein
VQRNAYERHQVHESPDAEDSADEGQIAEAVIEYDNSKGV